jgi:HD-GYP domain-containing protein (c-di-GMP phosphodiesterase class II)
MRLVPINCIKPGSYLSKSIYDAEGRILLAQGVELTSLILNKIKHHGIMSLYIQDEYSDNEIEDIIQPELRQKAIQTVKNYFDYSNFKQAKNSNSNEKNNMQYEYIKSLNEVAENIVEEIISQKEILINLVDIKIMDNYTYAHCVNVAVLSLVLGIEMGFNKKQLYDIAVGAMLHDIGKVFIPNDILNKKGGLTKNEFEIIKKHPQLGYDYLKDIYDINAFARGIVLQHHERLDGSGYPKGLEEDQIHTFAKIVAIADNYDALTSDRPYRKPISPNDALEYIMGSAGRFFDYDMVKAFMDKIIPYPIGTLVRLSNGCIGVIDAITPFSPLRPKVKVIMGNESFLKDEIIDLYENYSIVIEGVQYEDPVEVKGDKVLGF